MIGRICLAAALYGGLAAAAVAGGGEAPEPKEDARAMEEKLKEDGKAAAALARGDLNNMDAIRKTCEPLLGTARALTETYGRELIGKQPDSADWIRGRMEEKAAPEFEKAPVVLYGKAGEADVLDRWRGQLRESLLAVHGLIEEDKSVVAEWMYASDMKKVRGGDRYFRAEQIRNTLREVSKLLTLLALPRETVRVGKGGTILGDDFAGGMANWKAYGGGKVAVEEGKMKMTGQGCTVWCEKETGDAIISFDFTPLAQHGGAAGALFAFPASPLPGKDFSASAGPMPNYNYGISTYHVSLCRGASGRTNLRRTGCGLKMLSTVRPDPCRETGRTYRVELLKYGPTFQVFVDGALIHSYVDAGVYGDPPAKGCFGIRHFAGADLDACYDNFEIAAIVPRH
ncbi:MAG: DUF1961 family protein [Planctomycetota bacterium]|nr:DUF1961 family protein [Planctomycetota bacterium]